MSDKLMMTAEKTIDALKAKGLTVAVAESCTGGMVSTYITSVPGASSVFELGVISYSSRIKNKILNVKSETLAAHGAISRKTALEMASHIRLLADADIGISVTGVAGPSTCEDKLPGVVYIAIADHKTVLVERLDIEPESRNYIRTACVKAIFELLDKNIEKRR